MTIPLSVTMGSQYHSPFHSLQFSLQVIVDVVQQTDQPKVTTNTRQNCFPQRDEHRTFLLVPFFDDDTFQGAVL